MPGRLGYAACCMRPPVLHDEPAGPRRTAGTVRPHRHDAAVRRWRLRVGRGRCQRVVPDALDERLRAEHLARPLPIPSSDRPATRTPWRSAAPRDRLHAVAVGMIVAVRHVTAHIAFAHWPATLNVHAELGVMSMWIESGTLTEPARAFVKGVRHSPAPAIPTTLPAALSIGPPLLPLRLLRLDRMNLVSTAFTNGRD